MAGDFIHDTDSIATTLGQIASSFIPLVDVRDIIGNLVHGDFLFAGLSATGLIPVGGDLAKTAGKGGKFVLKNIDDIAKVSDILEFLVKNLPDALPYLADSDEFADAMKQLSKVDTSKLTKKQTEVINESLEKAKMSEYKLMTGSGTKTYMNGKAGEVELANMYGGRPQAYFKTTQGGRYIDQLADGIAHESKVGYVTLTNRIRTQILKDAELIRIGQIDGAHWHFFTSGITNRGGASRPLLDFLKENGIAYTIH